VGAGAPGPAFRVRVAGIRRAMMIRYPIPRAARYPSHH